MVMASIEQIKGADNGNEPDKLYEAYPKINRSLTNVNNQVVNHEGRIVTAEATVSDHGTRIEAAEVEIVAHEESTAAHAAEHVTYDGAVVGATNIKEGLDGLKDTLDNVIVEGGDGTQAAAAAVSVSGTTYDTLKDRVDTEFLQTNAQLAEKAEQSALIATNEIVQTKASIIDVNTQIAAMASGRPSGAFATLTDLQAAYPVGAGGVYLVSADGFLYYWNGSAWTASVLYVADGDITDFPATNLVVNGDFSTGTTGWTGSGATLSAVSNILSVTGVSSPTVRAIKDVGVKPAVGSKLYFRGSFKVTNSSSTFIYFILRDGTGGTVLTQKFQTSPVSGTTYIIKDIVTVTSSFTNNLTLLVDHRYSDSATGNGKVMEVQWVEVFNLTSIFGAGYEPSVSEFDSILSKFAHSYIDGTVTPIVNVKDVLYSYPVKKVSEGAVKPESTNFFQNRVTSNNHFNKATVTTGSYVRSDNGVIAVLAGYNAGAAIAVTPGDTYIRTFGEQLAFYDSNNVFVSGISGGTGVAFVIPAGAVWMRNSVQDSQLNTFQVNKGSSLQAYDAYVESYLMDASLIYGLNSGPVDNNYFIVDKSGGGNYSAVGDAINAAKAKGLDSTSISIRPGTYEEKLDLKQNPNISLIGVNRKDCIIIDKSGDYVNAPLALSGNGYFKDMTFIANHDDNPTLSGVTTFAYAVHYDYVGPGTTIFENCDFKSYQAPAVGIGMHQDQTLIFRNCDFYKDSTYNGGCFYAHNAEASGVTNQRIIIDNCRIISEQGRAISLTDANIGHGDGLGNDMIITFINTMAYSKELGKNCLWVGSPPQTSSDICGFIDLGVMSYGNNITALNVI
jgi:hypothetical protein